MSKRQYTRQYLHDLYSISHDLNQQSAIVTDLDMIKKEVLKSNEQGRTIYMSQPFLYREDHINKLLQGVKEMFVDSIVTVEQTAMAHDLSLNKTIIIVDWTG